MTPIETSSIDQLNSFLRGELSAVETYQKVLTEFPNSAHRTILQQCADSHLKRVQLLSSAIRGFGADPADSSGVWGGLAKLVESGAAAFGEKAAIAALEEGEDHGRDDYHRDLDNLDPVARQLVEERLIPEQQRTHDAISVLKRGLAA